MDASATSRRDVPLLETRGLSKSYAGHTVLDRVDLTIGAGETVAIIGENGAGKSTFAKIVAGVVRPESGTMLLRGTRVEFRSPRAALAAGIAFIPQELAYAPALTVAENIELGRWPSRMGVTSLAQITRQAAMECERLGVALALKKPMSELKLADRQIAEIVRALARRAGVLVLDEPTAPLSERESDHLFSVLRRMADQGVGVLYVSHRMEEVARFSDRVGVFRNGVLVAVVNSRETSQRGLVAHMLGDALKDAVREPAASATGAAVLSLHSWSSAGTPSLHDLNVEVRAGEILGLYGLRGSGFETVAEGLGGLRRDVIGTVATGDLSRPVFRNPLESKAFGIAYVPADRKTQGLVLGLSVQANLTLAVLRRVARVGVVDAAAERRLARELARIVSLRFRDFGQPVWELSGGNQQKVLLASRIAVRPRFLVLYEPTRGVDVGARLEIHDLLRGLANAGTAVVLATSDVEEAVTICDRLLILRTGEIAAELSGSDLNRAAAVTAAVGGAE